MTPQEDEYTRKFIHKLLASEHGELTPVVRTRLNAKENKLMKIIRRHSFGPIESKELKESL
jgi:hypothetical protein